MRNDQCSVVSGHACGNGSRNRLLSGLKKPQDPKDLSVVLEVDAEGLFPKFCVGNKELAITKFAENGVSGSISRGSIVGAVCDRAFFLELTKCERSQTAPTVGNPSLRLLPRGARGRSGNPFSRIS